MADEVKEVKETTEEGKKTRRVIPIEEKIASAEKKVAFYKKNLASAEKKLAELKLKQQGDRVNALFDKMMKSGKSIEELEKMFS